MEDLGTLPGFKACNPPLPNQKAERVVFLIAVKDCTSRRLPMFTYQNLQVGSEVLVSAVTALGEPYEIKTGDSGSGMGVFVVS
jgi:hypothetical protein